MRNQHRLTLLWNHWSRWACRTGSPSGSQSSPPRRRSCSARGQRPCRAPHRGWPGTAPPPPSWSWPAASPTAATGERAETGLETGPRLRGHVQQGPSGGRLSFPLEGLFLASSQLWTEEEQDSVRSSILHCCCPEQNRRDTQCSAVLVPHGQITHIFNENTSSSAKTTSIEDKTRSVFPFLGFPPTFFDAINSTWAQKQVTLMQLLSQKTIFLKWFNGEKNPLTPVLWRHF